MSKFKKGRKKEVHVMTLLESDNKTAGGWFSETAEKELNPSLLMPHLKTVFTPSSSSIQETLDCFLIEETLMWHDYIFSFWVNYSLEVLMEMCGKWSELQYQDWNKSTLLSFSLSQSTRRQIGMTPALRWQEGFEPQSHFHLLHFPSDENHLSCSVVISKVCKKPT